MSTHPTTDAASDMDWLHPDEVMQAHARVLAGSSATSRYLEMGAGHRVHAIESGEGPPVILVHGSGPSALLFLPLIERLEGLRVIAVDRPGFGLSDAVDGPRASYRDGAVAWIDSLFDALAVEDVALVGSSMGGTWALWFALAHPDRLRRLVLLGAPPLSPGTRVPPPLLKLAYPDPAAPPRQMSPPSRETVVGSMAMMGEGETIIDYPEQIEALIAAGHDRVAANANVSELRATLAPSGWSPELEIGPEELRGISVPTMLIWGERDPLGGLDVARGVASELPDARLELLPTGHAPWLGDPGRAAGLLNDFLGR